MQVHVLNGVYGEDPPESVILGVFAKLEDAEKYREQIIENTNNYSKEATSVASQISDILNDWKFLLPKFLKINQKDYWQKIHDSLKLYSTDSHCLDLARSQPLRDSFIGQISKNMLELKEHLDFPLLPVFPCPVQWKHDYFCFSGYEMQIVTKTIIE